jgi:hypothetical protein
MSLRRLLRDPLAAAGAVELNPAAPASARGASADVVGPSSFGAA